MFYVASAFNGDLSVWEVFSVTSMMVMFTYASTFNQDISAWDVFSVTDMDSMFQLASAFNQDLSAWDVSNVTDMVAMFYAVNAFNHYLSAWNVSSVTNMRYMFDSASAFKRWKIRCDTQYSDSLASNFKREQIIHQIQTLYTMKDRLLQQHKYMFNTTLEEWESLPTTQLSEWILKYKPVIKACLNTAQLQLKQKSSDIRKFYPSTATIPATKSTTTRRKTKVTQRKKQTSEFTQ
eukprot:scaffold129908_cov79-Attheya_sp.AAC.1